MIHIEKLNEAKNLCNCITKAISDTNSESIPKDQLLNAQTLVAIANTDLNYPENKTFFLANSTKNSLALPEFFAIDKFINDQLDEINEKKETISSAIKLSNKILSEFDNKLLPKNQQINELITKAFISSTISKPQTLNSILNVYGINHNDNEQSIQTKNIIENIYKLKFIIDTKLNNIIDTSEINSIIKNNKTEIKENELIRYTIIKIREQLIEKETQYVNADTIRNMTPNVVRPYLYKYTYKPLSRHQAEMWYAQLESYGDIHERLPYRSIIEKIINDTDYDKSLVNDTIKELVATDNIPALVYYIIASITLEGFILTLIE